MEKHKTLIAPFVDFPLNSISEIQEWLKCHTKATEIDKVNWFDFPYCPQIALRMAWSTEGIYLLYEVEENGIRGTETRPNGIVWDDSCCEFFWAFDQIGYYNLEVNCIGTPLLSYGPGKQNREMASESIMEQIVTWSSLGKRAIEKQNGTFVYHIVIFLPKSCFFKHLNGFKWPNRMKGNFYKCGDDTPTPHFISWNAVLYEQPYFHLPEYFGEIVLG